MYGTYCDSKRPYHFVNLSEEEIKRNLDKLDLKHFYDIDECVAKVSLESAKMVNIMEKMSTSNVSKLDFAKKDDIIHKDNETITVEHILLSSTINDYVKNENKMDSDIVLKLLLKTMVKAKEDMISEPLSEDDKKAKNKVNEIITRSTNPINEFMHNDLLFLSSFPLLFLLGEGWYAKGSAKQDFLLHLFRQYDHRFGRDQRYYYYYYYY